VPLSRQLYPASPLVCAIGICCAGSAALAATPPQKDGDAYARLSGDILAEALFVDEAPAFLTPPWITTSRGTSEDVGGTYVSAGWVLLSDELGAADRFVGTGSGVEVRIDLTRPSGWGVTLAYMSVDRGVYSAADDRGVSVERFLLGVSRTPARDRRWGLAPGVGVAWNVFDIHGDDPALDIEGGGGYVELRAIGRIGRRFRIEAGGRAIYWRGKDGLGGSGAEVSVIVSAGLALRF
jgi:hypothetical protein